MMRLMYDFGAGARWGGGRGILNTQPAVRPVAAPALFPRVVQVMKDLLDMAARLLVPGGRLVYLLPCTTGFVAEELPVHPCLATIANCEERLTLSLSRRVIVMKKVRLGTSCCGAGPSVVVNNRHRRHCVHNFILARWPITTTTGSWSTPRWRTPIAPVAPPMQTLLPDYRQLGKTESVSGLVSRSLEVAWGPLRV